jgi:hypothetical protein
MAFRSTSPHLQPKDGKEVEGRDIVRECPVGMVLRETPYVYDAVSAASYVESGALNPLEAPRWLQDAARIVGSERGRMFDIKQQQRRGASDAAYAAKKVAR